MLCPCNSHCNHHHVLVPLLLLFSQSRKAIMLPLLVHPCLAVLPLRCCTTGLLPPSCRRKADPIIEVIEERVSKWAMIPTINSEDMQVGSRHTYSGQQTTS